MDLTSRTNTNGNSELLSSELAELCNRMELRQLQIRNKAISIIEFNPEGYVTHIKNVFLRFIGYPKEHFLGKHFSDILNKSPITPDVWNRVLSGELIDQNIIVNTSSGKKYSLKFIFEAEVNDKGIPYKVKLKTDKW